MVTREGDGLRERRDVRPRGAGEGLRDPDSPLRVRVPPPPPPLGLGDLSDRRHS